MPVFCPDAAVEKWHIEDFVNGCKFDPTFPGMGSSRTGLDLEDTSRTKFGVLGLDHCCPRTHPCPEVAYLQMVEERSVAASSSDPWMQFKADSI